MTPQDAGVAQLVPHELEREESVTQISHLNFTLTCAQYLKEEEIHFY